MDKLVERVMRGANVASVVAEDMGEQSLTEAESVSPIAVGHGMKYLGSSGASMRTKRESDHGVSVVHHYGGVDSVGRVTHLRAGYSEPPAGKKKGYLVWQHSVEHRPDNWEHSSDETGTTKGETTHYNDLGVNALHSYLKGYHRPIRFPRS